MLQIMAIILSWFLVAFGQAAWLWQLGPFAAAIGFALFWFFSIQESSPKKRFWYGFFWYASIQLVQYSWSITHPYAYIYALLFVVCSIYGAQFGWITYLITEKRLKHIPALLGISALWIFNEWLRLHLLLALPWNVIGLSLATTTYGMQGAALTGVYGLSFLVIFTNLMALRAYTTKKHVDRAVFLCLVAFPYLFGWGHLAIHEKQMAQTEEKTRYLLVQTNFPVEESMGFTSIQAMADFVMDEWQQILHDLAKDKDKQVDIVVLPEYVVPFSTMSPVYRYTRVKAAFIAAFGESVMNKLPQLSPYLAAKVDTPEEKEVWMVNNAFWIQGIANIFGADVVAGLEDRDIDEKGEVAYFSAGILFHPHRLSMQRYEKRVLVPMGEYIPFAWCRELCRQYGIGGSFTPGIEGKALQGSIIPVGVSICYEETLGHLMRENRLKGAEVLINLTNDGWYPQSRLPWQHFEHSRLRTVEAGIPLVRACNTGVTAAVDSLGRDISYLCTSQGDVENLHGTLYVEVPNYTYHTLYTRVGDYMILGFSAVALAFWFLKKN